MDKVDEMRSKVIVDAVLDCLMRSLENLLEKQTGPMQIHDDERRKMARERLLAAYVDVAGSLHAHQLEKFSEEFALIGAARQKISEMVTKLQHG
jgi:hypothetical protein